MIKSLEDISWIIKKKKDEEIEESWRKQEEIRVPTYEEDIRHDRYKKDEKKEPERGYIIIKMCS
ncbi:MAG: hypothetical protein Q8N77_04110 [Nanoarchaeota archaeon]|nr:hypothetical protein [Nanoarchaeota archaeon]